MRDYPLRNVLVTLLVLLWLTNLPLDRASADEQQSQDSAGRDLYVKYGCYQCHGYEGQGSLFTGPRIAPGTLPLPACSEIVRRPYGSMPAYSPAVLDDETLEAIHTYLLTIAE